MNKSKNVLRYSTEKVSRSKVRRQYEHWREHHGLLPRCDNPDCRFHAVPLTWNGKRLPLILDHVEGNRKDNRPELLRYLCPNCEAQLETRGGRNRGRVIYAHENSFLIMERDGRKSYT